MSENTEHSSISPRLPTTGESHSFRPAEKPDPLTRFPSSTTEAKPRSSDPVLSPLSETWGAWLRLSGYTCHQRPCSEPQHVLGMASSRYAQHKTLPILATLQNIRVFGWEPDSLRLTSVSCSLRAFAGLDEAAIASSPIRSTVAYYSTQWLINPLAPFLCGIISNIPGPHSRRASHRRHIGGRALNRMEACHSKYCTLPTVAKLPWAYSLRLMARLVPCLRRKCKDSRPGSDRLTDASQLSLDQGFCVSRYYVVLLVCGMSSRTVMALTLYQKACRDARQSNE